MERPSHKELASKLQLAAALVNDRRWAPADPVTLAANFEELNLFLADEQRAALAATFSEIRPEDYRGAHPPQRSYERVTRGAEVFAFEWDSERLDGRCT